MSPPRFHHPDYTVFLIGSKCVDDQLLLAPTDVCRFVVMDVLQRALARYVDVMIIALVMMGNHPHILLRVRNDCLSDFMRDVKSGIGRRMNAILGRRGAFWMERYRDPPVLDDEAVMTTLHYIHANPLRAGLVERCEDYPGVSSFHAYLSGTNSISTTYFDEDGWRAAGADTEARERFTHTATVPIGRPPSWEGMNDLERRAADGAVVANIRDEERSLSAERESARRTVPPVESLPKKDPRGRPAKPKRDRKRKWAFGAPELVEAHRVAYSQMLPTYRAASRRYRETGELCPFPAGTYPPRIAKAFEVMTT